MAETGLPPLLLIGCGKMGGAMLAGWLERGLRDAVAVEPNPAAAAPFADKARVVASPDTVFISIMAGQMVAGIRAGLGGGAMVVRAMPNTPAAVRQGFTVAFPAP